MVRVVDLGLQSERQMGRSHTIILLLTLASSAGCLQMQRGENLAPDRFAKVTFSVQGMMKAKSGAT